MQVVRFHQRAPKISPYRLRWLDHCPFTAADPDRHRVGTPNKERMMIACICRNIYEEDYDSEESLEQRIMESDFKCGQCQLRYEFAEEAET